MQDKSIEEQNQEFIRIISQNKDLMEILNYVDTLQLPNYYLAAGSIFQTIWNYYDKKPLNEGIKDIDIIYYDNSNLTIEKDLEYYHKMKDYLETKGMSYEVDVSNEARMHLWKKDKENKEVEQYKNSEDAISKWIATVHAIGITKKNGKIYVYAPYGFNDIFTKTIRPIKHKGNSKELYEKKVESWKKRFSQLNVIEW